MKTDKKKNNIEKKDKKKINFKELFFNLVDWCKKNQGSIKRCVVSVTLLFISNLILCSTRWMLIAYDSICIDQFIYAMKSSAKGTHAALAFDGFLNIGVLGTVITIAEILVYMLISGRFSKKLRIKPYLKYCSTKVCRFFKKTAVPLALVVLIASISFFSVKLEVVPYIKSLSTESDFIENNYVDPDTATLKFPEQKRNLIYIFLESFETTFGDTNAGGPITEDFIPELTALQRENINFSNTSDIGGAYMYTGTSWTAAAMVTQTSGVTVKIPLSADNYSGEGGYMPGISTLGDVLEKEGYNQTLLVGSNAEFGSRDCYFKDHGNYNIVDTESLIAEGRFKEEDKVFWGFEDEKLIKYAKEEITKLAEKDEPFNFTMLTVDSHFPDGYKCRLCKDEHSTQYANVLSCSSKQISAFVEWIQEQPFYENTTIVISGDHLTMDPKFLEGVDENFERTMYNCIINSPIEPVQEKNRQFASFDMFPTTLAAMGVEIKGDKLGLGVNLFSEKETLTEIYGFDKLDTEMQKKSIFYNTKFFEAKED